MMDEMVVKLGVEQEDDDAQKKWCEGEFDTTEDQSRWHVCFVTQRDNSSS